MANISVSFDLSRIEGFTYLVQKDAQGNKVYYAGIPVKKLFNPSGTKKVYATAIMIPTPNSEYSDFMLKPMLSAQELQSMSPEDFRALPVLGTCKYMQQAVSKDISKDAAKSAVVDDTDLDDMFGMGNQAPSNTPAPNAQPAAAPNPANYPDTPLSMYYITDGAQIIGKATTWLEALQMYKALPSTSAILTKYEGNQVVASWTKLHILQLGV